MDWLTDSIAVDAIRAIGSVVAVGAARAATIGSATSIEALRAFLRGEQFYRRTQWDSAVAHYRHAAGLDSTLAIAWRRLGAAASWQRLQQDSLVAVYLLRAGATNHGYGPRDSLLILADSLSVAADAPADAARKFGLTRRLFATLDEVVRRYPDEAGRFGVYWLAEPPFAIEELARRIIRMYETMSDFFDDRNSSYRVFIRQHPYRGQGGTGAAPCQVSSTRRDDMPAQPG